MIITQQDSLNESMLSLPNGQGTFIGNLSKKRKISDVTLLTTATSTQEDPFGLDSVVFSQEESLSQIPTLVSRGEVDFQRIQEFLDLEESLEIATPPSPSQTSLPNAQHRVEDASIVQPPDASEFSQQRQKGFNNNNKSPTSQVSEGQTTAANQSS